VLDEVARFEDAGFLHGQEFVDHVIEGGLQWRQKEEEGMDVVPILNLERLKHLPDIVHISFVLQCTVRVQNVAHSGQFQDELVLNSLGSELGNRNA
jgi:hypothetical protein